MPIVRLVTSRSNDSQKANLLVITDHSLHNPQFTSTPGTRRGWSSFSKQSFVHSFSKVSYMQQYGNIDESVVREDCRYIQFLSFTPTGWVPAEEKRVSRSEHRSVVALRNLVLSLALSLSSALSRLFVPTRKITRETKARFLVNWLYWPTLESSREVTRDEDIDSAEVTHPWWGFELVE